MNNFQIVWILVSVMLGHIAVLMKGRFIRKNNAPKFVIIGEIIPNVGIKI